MGKAQKQLSLQENLQPPLTIVWSLQDEVLGCLGHAILRTGYSNAACEGRARGRQG